jgi:hypothetical protein
MNDVDARRWHSWLCITASCAVLAAVNALFQKYFRPKPSYEIETLSMLTMSRVEELRRLDMLASRLFA